MNDVLLWRTKNNFASLSAAKLEIAGRRRDIWRSLPQLVLLLLAFHGFARAVEVTVGVGGQAFQGGQDQTFPFTQTVSNTQAGSFDVQFGAALNSGAATLYISRYQGGLQISSAPFTSATTGDFRNIDTAERLDLTFSNIAPHFSTDTLSIALVSMTAASLNGTTVTFRRNGSGTGVAVTGDTDSVKEFALPTALNATAGDTLGLVTSGGGWQLRSLKFRMQNLYSANPSFTPYITTTNRDVRETVVTQDGRFFYTANFTDPANRPNGVAVAVVDGQSGSTIRFVGANGPATTAANLDLGLLVPGDRVIVVFGRTGTVGENSAAWSSALTQRAAFYSSGYADPAEVPLNLASPLGQLDVFTQGYPRCYAFRSDFLGSQGYSYMSNTVSQSQGHGPKVFAEERVASAVNLPLMQQFAQQNPGKIALCHYNFKVTLLTPEPSTTIFSPAHWVYFPGATLSSSITSAATELTVSAPERFLAPNTDGTALTNDVVAIVPLDGQGRKLWDSAELAAIRSIAGNQLTVLRGLFRTTATAFSAGAYVVPLSQPYNADATEFRYNFSANCPLDSQGRNCGDAFAELWRQRFLSNGPLARMHGILSDVFERACSDPVPPGQEMGRYYDTDGDGLADGGRDARGYNVWHLGAYDFARKLRVALGANRLLLGDGYRDNWARMMGVFNGIESEGLVEPLDSYAKNWSRPLNLFPYWQTQVSVANPESHIVPKFQITPPDSPPGTVLNLTRLAWSTAAILGVNVALSADQAGVNMNDPDKAYRLRDEFKQGVDNQPNWLGQPVGPMIRPAASTPDLLGGAGVSLTPAFIGAWTSSIATMSLDGDAMRVRSSTNAVGPETETMTISYPGIVIPSGDLFFKFRLKLARAPLAPPQATRFAYVTVNGRQINASTADQLDCMAGENGFTDVAFFYRGAGPATVTINLTFEGRQDAWIKDFTVHNATDVVARKFANGVAIANPSENPVTVNLTSLFPGTQLRRIQGNSWDDPITNNGQLVGPSYTLPALSGAFLFQAGTLTPFTTWQQANFGPDFATNSNAAATADPNLNGIANLLEYALNGDSNGTSGSSAILPIPSRDGANRLQLSFTRQIDRSDILLTVQANDNLAGAWADLAQSVNGMAFTPLVAGTTVQESGTGNTRAITVTDIYPIIDPAHPQRFMRLRVTQ